MSLRVGRRFRPVEVLESCWQVVCLGSARAGGWEAAESVQAVEEELGPGAVPGARTQRRPGWISRAPAENSRSRSREGSQRRTWELPSAVVKASSWVQAVSSQAMSTRAHQIWFWLEPWRGRLIRVQSP